VALNELLQTLEAEAAARIEEIRSRARAEVERVRRDCEAELSRRQAATLEVRQADLRAAAAREVAAARREAARRMLEAREATLARIRGRVRERLAARAEDTALLPLLHHDLQRGLDFVGEGAVVRVAGALLDGLRRSLDGRRDVSFEPAIPARSGLVLRSADGRITVDATLESRLDQAWPRLAVALMGRLEPAGWR
jgi:vacuolar-type H+-ATPase subunit E/Vma4